MTDSQAVALLRDLARRYQAVEVTFSDCGCVTIQFFANGAKICEEDKDLSTAAGAATQRAAEAESRELCR